MSWWGRYVGLPFGDGPGQVHCWGLVCLVFADQRGIRLAPYPASWRDHRAVHRAMTDGQDGPQWQPVDAPQVFDVAVMRHPRTGRIGHVGVMVDAGRVLHVEASSAAVVVPIDHFSVRSRIAGFRRYCA